ncbi:diacylglycerol/lipid kinase family protein [Salinimicrobium flavum]|uniref:Diacylglycerol/lipid kinase family protein n=1 Tax=Salinimicrobium flavum TaxID=1737065 RepID=A0ABW5IVA2_9FLAO
MTFRKMKKAQIIHNPTAGNEEHDRKHIISLLEKSFEDIRYVSTKTDRWEDFEKYHPDVIFVVGGDGTVHKVAEVLMKTGVPGALPPVHVIPKGTANNIARTLGTTGGLDNFHYEPNISIQPFNVGKIQGMEGEQYFYEGVGFGIIPRLIRKMQNSEVKNESPEEELRRSVKTLLEITKKYNPKTAYLEADGEIIKGGFLLVELLNINYIGPNLFLAPAAEMGDGLLDLVMIPQENRELLITALENVLSGTSSPSEFQKASRTMRVKKVKMQWNGTGVHIDDDLVKNYSRYPFSAMVAPVSLQFFRKD